MGQFRIILLAVLAISIVMGCEKKSRVTEDSNAAVTTAPASTRPSVDASASPSTRPIDHPLESADVSPIRVPVPPTRRSIFDDSAQAVPATKATVSATTNTATTSIATTTQSAPEDSVDLLKNLQLPDAIRGGRWSMKDGVLEGIAGKGNDRAKVRLAPAPAGEYDFVVKFVCPEKGTLVSQVLVFEGTPFVWTMTTRQSGFGQIKGKGTRDNASTVRRTLEGDKTYVSTVKVRRDGVSAYLNGDVVSEYKTDYADMSLWPEWRLPPENGIGIITESRVQVSEALLTPVSSELVESSDFAALAAAISDPFADQTPHKGTTASIIRRAAASTQPVIARAAAALKDSPDSPASRLNVWNELTASAVAFYPDAKTRAGVVTIESVPGNLLATNASDTNLSDVTLKLDLVPADSAPAPAVRQFYFIRSWSAGQTIRIDATFTPNLESEELSRHREAMRSLPGPANSVTTPLNEKGLLEARVRMWSNELRQPEQAIRFNHEASAAQIELARATWLVDELLRNPSRIGKKPTAARVLIPPKVDLTESPPLTAARAFADHVLAYAPAHLPEFAEAKAFLANPVDATRTLRKRQLDEWNAALPPGKTRLGSWTVRSDVARLLNQTAELAPPATMPANGNASSGQIAIKIDSRTLDGLEIAATLSNLNIVDAPQKFTGRLELDDTAGLVLRLRTAQSAAATQRIRTDRGRELPTHWLSLTLKLDGKRIVGTAQCVGGPSVTDVDVALGEPQNK